MTERDLEPLDGELANLLDAERAEAALPEALLSRLLGRLETTASALADTPPLDTGGGPGGAGPGGAGPGEAVGQGAAEAATAAAAHAVARLAAEMRSCRAPSRVSSVRSRKPLR